jgi:hypothetical protein
MENKETLEEAVANSWFYYEHVEGHLYSTSYKNGFKEGAKWQAERMYSEKDIARAFNEGMAYETMGKYIKGEEWVKTHKKEWFEQFKQTKDGI